MEELKATIEESRREKWKDSKPNLSEKEGKTRLSEKETRKT